MNAYWRAANYLSVGQIYGERDCAAVLSTASTLA
jgi:phosphoketolase